jgi:putative SOS response-associated peptidase YedK
MCGRFTCTMSDATQLALDLGIEADSFVDYRPRDNIAPTDPHWIVRTKYEDRELLPATWGLVNTWAKDAKRAAAQINARAETLQSKPAFREAFDRRRCVVPADGFFEWTGPKTARRPLWFHRPDRSLLLFAGLYEYWASAPGQWQRTFTIVTTAANQLMLPIHDRMPVILDERDVDAWLAPRQSLDALRSLLAPAAEDLLVSTAVSPRANSVKNDDAAILDVAAGASFGTAPLPG